MVIYFNNRAAPLMPDVPFFSMKHDDIFFVYSIPS